MLIFDYWHWFILGVVLIIAEIITPTSFFIWIALGAFITGVLSFAFSSLTPEVLGIIFAITSVACAFLGRRFVKLKQKPTKYPDLNHRGAKMIGKNYTVSKAVENGVGKVKVGDSEWRVECSEDIPVGENVIVESVDGATLIVKKA